MADWRSSRDNEVLQALPGVVTLDDGVLLSPPQMDSLAVTTAVHPGTMRYSRPPWDNEVLCALPGVVTLDDGVLLSPFSSSNGFLGCNNCSPPLKKSDCNQ